MVYTEAREINGSKYYYRVLSIRKEGKVSKKRIYLGVELNKKELKRREQEADKKILNRKPNRKIEKIKAKIIPILKKNKVTKAGIFGSYARGEQKKESDIDIVVNIEDKKMSLIGFIRLVRLLEEALKKKVDLVEYSAIKPIIKKSILNEEVKIL
jgi:predicted nucleotidyltransferase